MKSLGDWVDDLKIWDIPVLQRSIKELAKLSGHTQKITASEISEVVLHDPLLTLKVLCLVNGMSRSRLSSEISTVEHAVMMLGVGPFFNRLDNLSPVEVKLKAVDGALPGLMQTMSRAHHAAWQARDWANFRADIKSEEVYIGALLLNMGDMLLWAYDPKIALKIHKLAWRNRINLPQAQKEILGFELRELQSALAEVWRLPELVQATMRGGTPTQPRVFGVTLAGSVAQTAESGWYAPQLVVDMEAVAGILHLSLDEVVSMVHRAAVQAARHGDWYGVPPAAAWLPLLPGDWPVCEQEESESSVVKAMPDPAPHADVLSQTMAEIAAHLDGTLNLHDMMALVLKGMHEGIGLNRVVFALITADRSAMKAKFVVGAEPDSPLRQFQIDMTARHLFSRVMEKVQGIWLNASNQNALEPMIPSGIRLLIGQGEFFAMSVFLHGKPIGLFYADSRHDGGELDDRRYIEFKQLCLRASQGLAHLSKK